MNISKNLITKFAIFFLAIQFIFTQDVSKLIQPKCSNTKIEYSILANMKEYLENENNIDKREFYSSLDDLKKKKIGTLSFFKLDNYSNVEKYNNIDDLLDALEKHEIDAAFVETQFANYTQINSLTLSSMSQRERKINEVFACDKNPALVQELIKFQEESQNSGSFKEEYYKLMGISEDSKKINRNLVGTKGTIKALTFKYPPYSYKDEDGEITGGVISFLYDFCQTQGYQLELTEAASLDEINQAIKDKSYDLISYFTEDDDLPENTFYFSSTELTPIIRYSNSPDSAKWTIYDSLEQYNGENLGCLNNYSFEYLYKEKFPNSKINYYDNDYDTLYALLIEDIEGFLTDETVAKNDVRKFPERITYIDINVTSDLGFAFKKNDNLLNEFNEFLKKQNIEELYKKWDVESTSDIKIEKDNYKGDKTIKAGFLIDSKPFSYKEDGEVKGIEIELLYLFAKSKNYNVNLIEFFNMEERMKIGEKGTEYNITGGQFTISEERAKIVSFSDPIYKIGTSLVIRKDTNKDSMKLTLLDNEYNQIPDNKAKLYSKVGDKILTSTCAFPDKFDYTLTIKCLIDDFNGTDPFTQGIESTTTEDKLNLEYSYLEINNILKGNELLNLPIIQESDKTEHICSEKDRVNNSETIFIIATILISLFIAGLFYLFKR